MGRGDPMILAVNPGSTSTKVALYEGEDCVFEESVQHSVEELSRFGSFSEQYEYRKGLIIDALNRRGYGLEQIAAVVGRGGLLRPLEGGTYSVNDAMIYDCLNRPMRQHACNLGAPIANEIARQASVPAYVVDPPCVDEFDDIARVSGLPEIPRESLLHALNLKAVARRAANDLGRKYEDLNLVVVHLGGGFSITAHRKGRMVDGSDASSSGAFAPERAGDLPAMGLINMCFSGKYTHKEMQQKMMGKGGLVAHLGTNSGMEVERRIQAGDKRAELVYRAMAYQVAKWIGQMAVVLDGVVDAIVIGGGLAHSRLFIGWIREKTEWIAPVIVYPGSDEMKALALGALRVLRGEERAKQYVSASPIPGVASAD
ncbi:MAG: butyrate kinase [Firmicutes bacterium]|jgi:butyrate kinase|nr:butyrate kinase [Bacillota bacterium]